MSILTEARKQTKGSTGSTVGPRRMLLEQFLEARCPLERGEAAPSAADVQPRLPPPLRRARPAENRALSRSSSPTAWDDCALRIVTLGDVLLDVVVLLSEPLAADGDMRASNRAGAGGQGANVA